MKKKKNSAYIYRVNNTPLLFVLAGPNGAGKTTSASVILPEIIESHEFVNADLIAKGISPFNPSSANILAARVMLKRIDELRSEKKTFVIETTLTTLSYANLFREMQQEGYQIILFYLYLASPELSIQRVSDRVKRGGHNIPEDVIRRRYPKGLKNLHQVFVPLVDLWRVFDNTSRKSIPIAEGGKKIATSIFNNDLWQIILSYE